MSEGNPYKLDTSAFEQLPFLFHEDGPDDGTSTFGSSA